MFFRVRAKRPAAAARLHTHPHAPGPASGVFRAILGPWGTDPAPRGRRRGPRGAGSAAPVLVRRPPRERQRGGMRKYSKIHEHVT